MSWQTFQSMAAIAAALLQLAAIFFFIRAFVIEAIPEAGAAWFGVAIGAQFCVVAIVLGLVVAELARRARR